MEEKLKREKILESAKTVFVQKGIKASTIGEIASLAGIGKPVLYQIFPGKNEILEELIEDEINKLKLSLTTGIRQEDNPLIKMARMWENAIDFYEKDDFLMYLLRGNELGLPPYMYNQYILDIETFVVNMIESVIKEAVEREMFVVVDSHIAAYISYKIYQACTYSKTDTVSNFTTKHIMQKVLELLGAGIFNKNVDVAKLLKDNKITEDE